MHHERREAHEFDNMDEIVKRLDTRHLANAGVQKVFNSLAVGLRRHGEKRTSATTCESIDIEVLIFFVSFVSCVVNRSAFKCHRSNEHSKVLFYAENNPPLMSRVTPVIKSAAGEHKKTTARAISSGVPRRRRGTWFR